VLEEKMKKQIEIVSLILAAAILVGLACAVLVCWMCHPASGAAATALLLINFGTSCWLFRQCDDPKANTAGVWALLGLVAGLFAVALYFLAEINRNVAKLAEERDSTTTT
jgi:hypothetical protein